MPLRLASFAVAAAIAACTLAACSDRPPQPQPYMVAQERRGGAPPAPPILDGISAARAAPANVRAKLAVTHVYTLAMSSRDVEAVQHRDLDACDKLGCTVLSSNLQRLDGGRVFARTSLRISPQSFDAFAKALAAPPVRIVSHSQSTEDKTIPLLDVGKRLAAKTALRDRLEAMLKDPATKNTADLLATEKELAQIQGDIESATAQRDYLRTITDTVRVDVSYDGLVAEVAGFDLAPLKRAMSSFGDTVLGSLASLIYVFAALLPWLPFILVFGWLVRRGLCRWRARRAGG
ncbi:MAG TPA: DUF4349 domain-containing protein [Xanthobacteraceae bacterium]